LFNISFLVLLLSVYSIFSHNLNKNNESNKLDKSSISQTFFAPFLHNQENSLDYMKYHFANNINCSAVNTCPKKFGNCKSPNECQCNKGFINYVENSKITKGFSGQYCSYEQKKQLYSFLIESFISFGIGHIYAERYLAGYSKLLLGLLIIILYIVQKSFTKGLALEDFSKTSPKLYITQILLMLVICIWQLIDIVLIGINTYLDGNGMPLESW